MRAFLGFAGALVSGLALGMGLDAIRLGRIESSAIEVVIGAIVGALAAATWPRLRHRSDPLHGAILGGVATFVLMRVPGWLDLGGLGAGPPGELSYVVLPIVSVLAATGAVRPRGASRARAAPGRAPGPSPRT